MEKIIEYLKLLTLPPPVLIRQLFSNLKEILVEEPNIIHIPAPVTVLGDISGQFFDLLEIVEPEPDARLLFLGNYTNLGQHNIQTLLYLFSLKVRCRDKVTLLRGAQQTLSATLKSGLYEQIMKQYGDSEIWKQLVEVFSFLPIAALVADSIFASHSGIPIQNSSSVPNTQAKTISPNVSLDCLRQVNRRSVLHNQSPLAQILQLRPSHYNTNSDCRPSSGNFSETDLDMFLYKNRLKSMLRSSTILDSGCEEIWGGKCMSVFSCPHFLHKRGNKGAVVKVADATQKYVRTFGRVKANAEFNYEPVSQEEQIVAK